MFRGLRLVALLVAVALYLGALTSYVVRFHQIEHTTAILAGAATAICVLLLVTAPRRGR